MHEAVPVPRGTTLLSIVYESYYTLMLRDRLSALYNTFMTMPLSEMPCVTQCHWDLRIIFPRLPPVNSSSY